jgi:hypothetical protein
MIYTNAILLLSAGGCLVLGEEDRKLPVSKVFAGNGVLVFRESAVRNSKTKCKFSSLVDNPTDTAYLHVELKAMIRNGTDRTEFPLRPFSIVARGTVPLFVDCPRNTPDTGQFQLSLVRAMPMLPEKDKDSDAQKRFTSAYLWSLPVLDSGTEAAFIGADQGCARDYLKALEAGGLEGRKTMRELLINACGETTARGQWIRIVEPGSEFSLVEVVGEGAGVEKKGWVPNRFIRPPKQYPY